MNNKINILILASMALLLFSCTDGLLIDEPGNLVPKTADQDPSLPSITVNGARLHSEAFGPADSSLVVCIHGGPGSDYRYMLNCADLADYGYRVVLYDQRGSGLSQRFSKKSYTGLGLAALDLLYDELSGVIAHYRTSSGQKVFLVGHSWGAMLATAYTGKHPEAVEGLVVAEPGGLKWDDVTEYVKETRSFNIWKEYLNDVTYLDQFISGRENDHEILDYKFGLLGSEENKNTDVEPETFWRLGAVINAGLYEVGEDHEPDFSEGINSFNAPILFFYSEKNKAYPDEWAQKITSVYNEIEIHKVAGTGHNGIISDRKVWEETTLPRILTYFDKF